MAATICCLDLGVEAAHGRRVDPLEVGRLRAGRPPACTGPRPTTWLTTDTSSRASRALARQPAATRAAVSRAEARSRTSRASSNPYFCMPGQIGVTRAGRGEDLGGGPGVRGHLLLPLGPLGVGDLDGHRRAQGPAVTDPAHQGDLVGLEPHPGAPAEPEAAPGQLGLDLLDRHRQAGRQALDDHDEGLAVGLAGGEVPEHGPNLPSGHHRPGARGASPGGNAPVPEPPAGRRRPEAEAHFAAPRQRSAG